MEKYGFQLNLLSDVGGAVRKAYEVSAWAVGRPDVNLQAPARIYQPVSL